jgi:hypothetical protein
MTTDIGTHTSRTPNWRHVGAFLGLTFGLTWLLDLAIFVRGGLGTPGMLTILQLAIVALLVLRDPVWRGLGGVSRSGGSASPYGLARVARR